MKSPGMTQVLLHMAAIMAPSSGITVSKWADSKRWISAESGAKAGQWVSFPYQMEPMDAVSDLATHRVVLVSATQMLKTSVIENAVGRFIDVDPGPILIIQPRKEDAVDFVEERIDPMIRDTEALRSKIYKVSKKQKKFFRGGTLSITSAGSPENAGRRAVLLLCLDEMDRYRLTREGNFVGIVRKRLATYESRGKEIDASSPTFENSEIHKAYLGSDQREYFVPCPLCGEEQSMMGKFKTHVRWNDKLPTLEEQALSARYHCQNCDAPWNENMRRAAVEQGKWIAKKPFKGVAGFWISELYSYSRRLDQVVLDYLEKKDNQEDYRGFVNTSLAENFTNQGKAPDWQLLVNRREAYSIDKGVPKEALLLTAGADVHPYRIEVELVGWGRNRWSWGLRKEIFEGNTSEFRSRPGQPPTPWEQLEAFIGEVYPHQLGGEITCSMLFVDSGNQANDVYQWVRTQSPARVMAIKGDKAKTHGAAQPVKPPSAVDVTLGGKLIKTGMKIRMIDVSFFKSELYADLKRETPTAEQLAQGLKYPTGYCHFPDNANYSDEHFKQLCGEQWMEERDSATGRMKWHWKPIRDRNEGLDIRIYARAAAWEQGMDRFKEANWQRMERDLVPNLFRAKILDPGADAAQQPVAELPFAALSESEGLPEPAVVTASADAQPITRACNASGRRVFRASRSRYV